MQGSVSKTDAMHRGVIQTHSYIQHHKRRKYWPDLGVTQKSQRGP